MFGTFILFYFYNTVTLFRQNNSEWRMAKNKKFKEFVMKILCRDLYSVSEILRTKENTLSPPSPSDYTYISLTQYIILSLTDISKAHLRKRVIVKR